MSIEAKGHDAPGIDKRPHNREQAAPPDTAKEPISRDELSSASSVVIPPNVTTQPPPNGGLTAWLHVVGGFMLLFNSWGVLNAFGVFQTYYESGALFDRSPSDISWIGAIQMFMILLVGVVVGPIYDRGYLRSLLITGSFGVVFGHMMLSLCKEYWQVVLAQGFVIGIGAGCLFVPCISLLPTYFTTRMGLALGLAYSGSSIGGVIYPIILYRLLDPIGFAWSVRVMGFVALGTLLIPIAVMRVRVKPPVLRGFIDRTAFTDIPYVVLVLTIFLGMIGTTILLFFISFYSDEQGILDDEMAFYLVPILNVGSCFGRVLPNAISDKIGPLNIVTPCALITGVLLFCLMVAKNEASIIVLAILSGFFSGVYIAMPPACFIPFIEDKSKIGTRIGMGYGIISFALLIGGPGAGAILGTMQPLNWHGIWAFGGASISVSGLLFAALRFYRSGPNVLVKV
ncbi:MFS general substrate transporter [Hypoxylon sp. FL1857]|nr:MFS general substrate transporter [Hypoxylon sp. FL1857]